MGSTQGDSNMLRRAIVLVVGTAALGLAVPTFSATTSETLKKLELDWTEASIQKNYPVIESIVAPDWVAQAGSMKTITRQDFIDILKSGDQVFTKVTLGPMTVRVMGNVAVIQGSADETSQFKGKDTGGKSTFTDVYEKRNGHWVVVNTQMSRVLE